MTRSSAVPLHPGPLLAVLAALTALAPLSLDIYTPSLPQIRADLGGPDWLAQASVTGCLLGIAAGQLICGPLSDRLGRRTVILAGVIGWTIASGLSAAAPTLFALDGARIAAGLTGSAGIVVARAVVRDISRSSSSIGRRIAVLATVSSIAPVVAPITGAVVASAWGWRADFVVLAVVGGVMLVAAMVAVPDTTPEAPASAPVLRALVDAARHPGLRGIAMALGVQSVGFYAYIATTSFVVERQYGYGPEVFALVFGTNAVAILLTNLAFRRLVHRTPARTLLGVGLAIALVGGLGTIAAAVSDASPALWLSAVIFASGIGLVLPAAHSSAQSTAVPGGAASAITGAAQFTGGVLGSPITGLLGPSALTLGCLLAVRSARALVPWSAARATSTARHGKTVR